MKSIVIILGVLFLILFSAPSIFAQENCTLAIPRYGRVECVSLGVSESIKLSFTRSGNQLISTYSCLSDCDINPKVDIITKCGFGRGINNVIEIGGVKKYVTPAPGNEDADTSIKWRRDQSFILKSTCHTNFASDEPPTELSASLSQIKIILNEGWAGSLPDTKIPGTEGCTLNSVIDKYKEDKSIDFLNPSTDKSETKPSSTYSSVSQLPTNWKVGDSYIFVKDWQTGIADISLTYDKQNNGYWCGGLTGNRKIYSVNKVISGAGPCYSIPTSLDKQVECCFPSDCSVKGSGYTCNPDTWKCEETKWCDSQLDCDQVFGKGVCQDNKVTGWTCDTTKKWGSHTGTCVKNIKDVKQCPSACTGQEYYNEGEGLCKPRSVILDCPAGSCCLEGGSYKPSICSNSLTCCTGGDSKIGSCKQSCTIIQEDGKTNHVNTKSAEQLPGLEIGSFLPVIIGGSVIGVVVLLVFILRKPKDLEDEEEF